MDRYSFPPFLARARGLTHPPVRARARVQPTNPLVYNLGIREAQLEEVMKGRAKRSRRLARPPPDLAAASVPPPHGADGAGAQPAVQRRTPTADDTCPICMESLDAGGSLVWCRDGCGNNVHRHCMLVWAKHRAAQVGGEQRSTCPMCRAPWGEIGLPEREERPRQTAARRREQRLRELADADAATHYGVGCSGCKGGAILGTRFRCIICDGYNLCTLCFAHEAMHAQHTFECIRRPGDEWQIADRASFAGAVRERAAAGAGGADGPGGAARGGPSADAAEGSAEAQIARLARVQMPVEPAGESLPPGAGEAVRSSPPPPSGGAGAADDEARAAADAPAAAALVALAHCAHCGRIARKQQWFKALPCGHHIHEACLPDWLRAHHGVCPNCHRTAVAVAPAAAARESAASSGAPSSLARAASATVGGSQHAGGAPVASRRRASGAATAAKRPSFSAAPATPLCIDLGVTGCSIGACAHGAGAGAPAPAGLATLALAGRGVGAGAPTMPLSVGFCGPARSAAQPPRQGAALRGRLARGMTSTVTVSR